jgi:hypothetical protein
MLKLSRLNRDEFSKSPILHLGQKPGFLRMMTLEKLNFSFLNPVF